MRAFDALMTADGGFNLGLQKAVGREKKRWQLQEMRPTGPTKYTFNYKCPFSTSPFASVISPMRNSYNNFKTIW